MKTKRICAAVGAAAMLSLTVRELPPVTVSAANTVSLTDFAEAMKKVFTDSGIRTISYAMYESNSHANAFREETLNMLKPSITVSENYFLEKGPDVI